MITTTYKCDRCGHKQSRPEQMWTIGISFTHGPGNTATYQSFNIIKADWCRSCLESFGFVPKIDLPKQAPIQEATIEDLIRNIVHEEMEP